MTREDAKLTVDYLKEIQEEYIEGDGYERYPLPEWYALDEAIELIEQTRWIPCSERLPQNKETVLVTFKHFVSGNTIGLGSMILLRGKPHWHVREQNLGTYDVLAWMPLPESYKSESEEGK